MTKVPHINRAILATMLSLPEHQIRCLPPDVGGGFGVRITQLPLHPAMLQAHLRQAAG